MKNIHTQKAFPKYLFKYRTDNENTKEIITKNELYFSNPLDFNDPYDCNIHIAKNTPLDEIINWLKSIDTHTNNINSIASQIQNNPNIIKEEIKKSISNMGICCFSTLEDSVLQWSHYSNYHKGICFKFDVTKDTEFFKYLVVVSYKQIMQHYNHFIHADKIVEYLIRYKYHDWSYESEVRIIKSEQEIIINDCKRSFIFKDCALTELIFGVNTSQDTIKEYQNLCIQNKKAHVQFYKMELGSGTHYELNKIKLK